MKKKSFALLFLCSIIIALCVISCYRAINNSGNEIFHSNEIDLSHDICLPIWKGSYTLIIDYEAANNDNSISILPPNDSYHNLLADTITLWSTKQQISSCFWVNDSVEYLIHVNCENANSLDIKSIRIISNASKAICLSSIIIVFTLLSAILILLHGHGFTFHGRYELLGILLITLAASLPLFTEYLHHGHDLEFHLIRIEGLKDGILSGTFPLRIQPTWINGYGYASSIMYGDILLYFPAFLRLLGFSIELAYKCFIFVINLATATICYYCVKKIFVHKYLALFGSALYTLSIYRFTNIYVRSAVGEYSAMLFFPLILCGLYLIFKDNFDYSAQKQGICLASIGYSGVIMTHTLSCEMVGAFTILACILLYKKVFQKNTFFSLCKVVIITALINLWWIVPFLDYLDEPLKINTWNQPYMQARGTMLAQLFSPFCKAIGDSSDAIQGLKNEMALSIGLGFTCMLIIITYIFVFGQKLTDKTYCRFTKITLVCGLWALFMTTVYFPYDKLMDYREIFNKYLGALQFPWRLLAIAVVFFTFAACAIIVIAKNNYNRKLSIIFAIIIGSGGILSYSYVVSSYIENITPCHIYDNGGLNTNSVMLGEYLPGWDIDTSILKENTIKYDEFIKITDYNKKYLEIDMNVENTSSKESYVELPILYYNGYTARNSITKVALPTMAGDNGVVRVTIPANYKGGIHIQFEDPWYWKLSEYVSIMFCLILIGTFIYNRIKSPNKNRP